MSQSTTKKSTRPKIALALVGASGRMGQKILEVLKDSSDNAGREFAIVWQGSLRNPSEVASLTSSGAEVLIDFSKPQGTLSWVRAFAKAPQAKRPAALICATGFDATETKFLLSSLKTWKWALVPNTSLGVFAMAESLKVLASRLPEDYVFSIHESHHAKKVDSPSGTGLFLQRTIAALRPKQPAVEISSVRGGTDPGTHTVTILGPFEKLSFTHASEDRRLFARGALVLGRSLSQSKKKGQHQLVDLVEA